MPIYTMKNIKTDEEQEHIFSFAERAAFLKANPDWIQPLSTSRLVSQVGSNLSKTDDGWKELLKKVKKGSGRTNTIKE
jgi:hypothetical protein